MLKKYLTRFTVDILPSVFATVVGAYIVNYYIIPKAREDRPPAPAAAMSAKPPETSQAKPFDAKPAETVTDLLDGPAPVRKADKPNIDKSEAAKGAEKAAESRRHTPARDKAVAKADPVVAPAPSPVLATVGTAPAGDANDLARAAIERLGRGEKGEARAPEPRAQERTASAQPPSAPLAQPPVQQAQPMQQLPPPIVLSNPNGDNAQPAERAEQSRGPRPPGSVPVPMRGNMQADADDRSGRTNVVEDVLSGAKSMFDKVIPRSFER